MSLVDQLAAYAGGDEHSILDGTGGRAPTQQELERTQVAETLPTLLDTGISYHAMWKKPGDGMAKHAREQVKALALTGLPLQLRSFGHEFVLDEDMPTDAERIQHLEKVSCSQVLIAIKHFVPHNQQLVRELVCPASVRNSIPEAAQNVMRSTIVYTSWERDRVHPLIVKELEHVGQLWVPCEANRHAFVGSGMDPNKVFVVPYTFDPGDHTIAAPRGSEDVPAGKRFYHIGKWEPRKNQHRMLGAFLLAYGPSDRASLFIKTSGFGNWSNYPSAEESRAFWLADAEVQAKGWTDTQFDRLVRIEHKRVSDADLVEIHRRNNIYVSASLGEAWDIPAFEAALAGNALVYSGFGGPEDYAGKDDIPVQTEMESVHPAYGWEHDAQWARVSTEALTTALREATPRERRVMPRQLLQYSHFEIGTKMFGLIKKLALELNPQNLSVLLQRGFG